MAELTSTKRRCGAGKAAGFELWQAPCSWGINIYENSFAFGSLLINIEFRKEYEWIKTFLSVFNRSPLRKETTKFNFRYSDFNTQPSTFHHYKSSTFRLVGKFYLDWILSNFPLQSWNPHFTNLQLSTLKCQWQNVLWIFSATVRSHFAKVLFYWQMNLKSFEYWANSYVSCFVQTLFPWRAGWELSTITPGDRVQASSTWKRFIFQCLANIQHKAPGLILVGNKSSKTELHGFVNKLRTNIPILSLLSSLFIWLAERPTLNYGRNVWVERGEGEWL